MFKINELLEAVDGQLICGSRLNVLRGVSIDSRSIMAGELFLAIEGERLDGHDFIKQAVKKGAAGIIAANTKRAKLRKVKNIPVILVKDTTRALGDIARWWRSRFDVPVICITGSNGKTTTKEMIAVVLESRFNVLKNIGTLNNQIGLPLTLLKLNPRHDMVVLELGTNHFGEIDYLSGIARPDIAIITNIALAHLEGFRSLEGVLREKSQIFNHLQRNGIAMVNSDDRLLKRKIADRVFFKGHPVLSFGLNAKSDSFAESIEFRNTILSVKIDKETFSLKTIAAHSVYNMLAAYMCGIIFGLTVLEIKSALRNFEFPAGRINLVKLINGVMIINDTYNANPSSVEAGLDSLMRINCSGRKIAVLGDMLELGAKWGYYHRYIGKKISRLGIDIIISVGKKAKLIAQNARRFGFLKDNVYICNTNREVTALLRDLVKPNDAVLVKGSRLMGMEEIVEYLKNSK